MAFKSAKQADWWEKWQRRGYWLWLIRTSIVTGVVLAVWNVMITAWTWPAEISWPETAAQETGIFFVIGIVGALFCANYFWHQNEGDYTYYKFGVEPNEDLTLLDLNTRNPNK